MKEPEKKEFEPMEFKNEWQHKEYESYLVNAQDKTIPIQQEMHI